MALADAKPEGAQIESAGQTTPTFSSLSVRNVLFGTDFSLSSEAALPYAAAICRRFGSTLHTAHILSDTILLMMSGGDCVTLSTLQEDAISEARHKLDQISERIAGIPHRNYIRCGQVWRKISEISDDNQVDLIVVGTHGRTGLGKMLLGSTAEDILRHASCPVLAVGPKVSGRAKLPALESHGRDLAPPELELRQLLFATNFTRSAQRLAQAAVQLSEEPHTRLTLMHVLGRRHPAGKRSRLDRGWKTKAPGSDSHQRCVPAPPGNVDRNRTGARTHPENRSRARSRHDHPRRAIVR